MRKKTLLILLSALIAGMSLRFYNLVYFYGMHPDESVCTQAVFAMTKGYFPYRDVFIAHPLLSFMIQYPFIAVDPSLLMARLSSVLLSFGTLLLVFYIAKGLYSDHVAVIATVLFAFSPYTLHYNKLAMLENTFLFFTTVLFYFFFKYYKSGSKKDLLLAGLFAGIALISKYTTLFVLIVLVCFIVVKKGFKTLAFFVIFASIIPSAFLLLLLFFNIHYFWYVQTVSFQLIHFNLPLTTKLWQLYDALKLTLPLFAMAIPTMFYREKWEDTMLTLLFVIPFLILFFGKAFLIHYLLIFTPIFCILAARSLDQFLVKFKTRKKRVGLLLMFVVLLAHFYVYRGTFLGSAQTEFFVRAKMEVADYIRSITEEGDKIWTTEADIAFFSQRLIVAPHPIWKFQGFWENVWGRGGFDYIGQFAGYPEGLISLNDIRQALENEKPKVFVTAYYKFADMYIWHGIDYPVKQEGLADYILTHYKLDRDLYGIKIYVRVC